MTNPEQNDSTGYESLDNLTVLIVDDNESMRNLLSSAITQWGYQVIEASNGEEAWEIMQKPNPPLLLMLDWLMPKLDGVALCKRLRKELDFYPYIIFLTQLSGTKNILTGLEAGADEFLLKPVNLTELRIRIFAGEKIINSLNIIEKQKNELRVYIAYSKVLEQLVEMLGVKCG